MNRKQKQVLFVSALAAILILLWLFRSRPTPPPLAVQEVQSAATNNIIAAESRASSSNVADSEQLVPIPDIRRQTDQNKRDREAYTSLWRTPLLFYGKVVDESNQPISGVQVSYNGNSVNESLTEEAYNKGTVTTDERGIFKIDGIRGIGLMFQLFHPDYYPYSNNSTGFDIRSPPRDGVIPNSEETASVFRMHHKGNPVALIARQGGLHKPADGTTLDFPLRGKTRSEIIGQLQVQGWKGEPDPQNNGHYDWKIRISVPGGGVLESSNEFDFIAPQTGYQQTLEISKPKDDPNWKPSEGKTLFFKLPNYFARGQANIDLYHDLYFSMQYFVNPDGSANLENDSSKPYREP